MPVVGFNKSLLICKCMFFWCFFWYWWHILLVLDLQRIAFTVSWSRPGRGPFFPLIELVRNSSSVNSSVINSLNKQVGCWLACLNTAVNDEDLISMPILFTGSKPRQLTCDTHQLSKLIQTPLQLKAAIPSLFQQKSRTCNSVTLISLLLTTMVCVAGISDGYNTKLCK